MTNLLPSKAERWNDLLGYIASNTGEDSMHAVGLFFTLAYNTGQPGLPEVTQDELDPTIQRMLVDNYIKEAWASFPPLSDETINDRFTAARLPLGGQATGTIDPVVRVLPEGAKPPVGPVVLPWLHNGGNKGAETQFFLKVTAPTTLTLDIAASNVSGGYPVHTCVVVDPEGRVIKRLSIDKETSARVTFPAVAGVYTVTFPDPGANKVTVSGGNVWVGIRMYNNRLDGWGYYPFLAGETSRSYFVIPADWPDLRVGLSSGSVRFAFADGTRIGEVAGSAATKANPVSLPVRAASEPRIAYVEFNEYSVGLSIEGVTLISPTPAGVLYER